MSSTIRVQGARATTSRTSRRDSTRPVVVFTGLSGSGKSSWPSDTNLTPRAQRRYVESLSAYARQFLGQRQPDVDFIEGLSPAISIDQKTRLAQPALDRGHDHRDSRLPAAALARVGVQHCRTAARSSPSDAPTDRRPGVGPHEGRTVLGLRRRSSKGERVSTARCSQNSRQVSRARASTGVVIELAERESADPRALREAHDRRAVLDRLSVKSSTASASPSRWRPR